jgi:hypothetical protein
VYIITPLSLPTFTIKSPDEEVVLRKILFTLIILLALLLAAEMVVTFLSQRGMEKAIGSQYELPSSLKVSINSFPLILSLARNHMNELRLAWEGNLSCSYGEGVEEETAYKAQVDLYDVELEMPSLLGGRLEIREISRIKAEIFLDEAAVNEIIGDYIGPVLIDDGDIYFVQDGEKVRYKVKVVDGRTLAFYPQSDYINDSGSIDEAHPALEAVVKEVSLEGLPLDSELEKASSDRGMVILEISVPIWEGYM